METTWIIVASRDDVRIFSRKGKEHLVLEKDIGNPFGRLKEHDLVSDKQGASTDNRMRARQSYSTEESSRERSLKDFYRAICEQLDHALSTHQFSKLVLVAEPRLLGYIRDILSKNCHRAIEQEIPKDLSMERALEIEQRL